MAGTYSLKAILSAKDGGFTSTMKKAIGSLKDFGDSVKNGFAFGVLTGMGQQAFSMLSSGASDLIGEINQSSKAWQTFEGNMKNFGKNEKEIASVKKELQSFAETTVYSSSDMASTYAQLEAVGVGGMKSLTKGTEGLVKGFGGLAAAAEDPQQAMKSLSQQATQMAAKPKVAWEDFKIMLEQSPAGMAAVADEMGISTEKLISKIQAGEVSTESFFAAIEKAGNSEGFAKMATEAKTVDQAFDGLKESIGNKLLPSFELLSDIGIDAIDGIAGAIGKIDGEEIKAKLQDGIEAAKPYWESFKEVALEVGGALKTFGSFLVENKDTIAKYVPIVLKAVLAFKAFSIIKSVVPGVGLFTKAIGSLAGKGISGLAGKLFGVSNAQKKVGDSSAATSGQMMASAKSMFLMSAAVLLIAVGFALLAQSAIALSTAGGGAIAVMFGLIAAIALLGAGMALILKTLAPMSAQLMPVATAMLAMGAAVLLVSIGFALMAQSAIALSNAGGLAIAVMAGLVLAMVGLAVGAAALGTALTAGAVGFIAFGAAVLMVGAGFALIGVAALLAATALQMIVAVLPMLCTYGTTGAAAIALLGAGLLVFATTSALAGAAGLVLAAGLLGATVSIVAFALAMTTGAAGTLLMVAALKGVSSQMKSISKNAKSTEKSLKSMKNSIKVVESGLDGLGAKAKSSMKAIMSAFDSTASKTQSSGKKVGTGFSNGLKSGLSNAPSVARNAVSNACSALSNGSGRAYQAGAYIGIGFANGMRSQLGVIRSVAAQMAAAADAALRAKAKIASPSKVTTKDGQWFGQGFADGILDKVKAVRSATEKLISIPEMRSPRIAMAYGGELSTEYDYTRKAEYNITVISEIDGRQVAKATAPYTEEELNKRQTRESRLKGRI